MYSSNSVEHVSYSAEFADVLRKKLKEFKIMDGIMDAEIFLFKNYCF